MNNNIQLMNNNRLYVSVYLNANFAISLLSRRRQSDCSEASDSQGPQITSFCTSFILLPHLPTRWLKALSVMVNSKFHFFRTPRFFCIFKENSEINKLPIQQFSQKQHIFGERDDSLLLIDFIER